MQNEIGTVVGEKNFPRYRFVSSRFMHCFICEISYVISCLMRNHIFISRESSRDLVRNIVWDFSRFRTRYRLGFLRDFVRDIVWDFTRFRTRYRLGFYEISYEISFGILRDIVRTFSC